MQAEPWAFLIQRAATRVCATTGSSAAPRKTARTIARRGPRSVRNARSAAQRTAVRSWNSVACRNAPQRAQTACAAAGSAAKCAASDFRPRPRHESALNLAAFAATRARSSSTAPPHEVRCGPSDRPHSRSDHTRRRVTRTLLAPRTVSGAPKSRQPTERSSRRRKRRMRRFFLGFDAASGTSLPLSTRAGISARALGRQSQPSRVTEFRGGLPESLDYPEKSRVMPHCLPFALDVAFVSGR